MIISLLSTKGGSGKTTTTFNLCDSLARKKKRVLAVDCDHRQALITICHSLGDKLRFAATQIQSLADVQNIKKIEANYDYVVIDSDPVLEDIQRSVALLSQMIIIPITPSPLDFIEAKKTISMLLEGKKFNEQLKICCLINRFSQRRRTSTILMAQLENFKQYGVRLLEQTIGDRASLANLMEGGTYDLDKNGKGVQEIDNLSKEIIELLRSVVNE